MTCTRILSDLGGWGVCRGGRQLCRVKSAGSANLAQVFQRALQPGRSSLHSKRFFTIIVSLSS